MRREGDLPGVMLWGGAGISRHMCMVRPEKQNELAGRRALPVLLFIVHVEVLSQTLRGELSEQGLLTRRGKLDRNGYIEHTLSNRFPNSANTQYYGM